MTIVRETLFERRCKVIIAAPLAVLDSQRLSGQTVEIEGLRVQFKVTKTLKKNANTADIRITNLAEHTRSSLQDRSAKVVLQAGYVDTMGQIFMGDVRTVEHTHEGPMWTTKIGAGDGERAMSHARVSSSFKGGVKLPDVVNVVARKMGQDLGNFDKVFAGDNRQFVNGYSLHGRASEELDRILIKAGYEWSMQDGRIQILKNGSFSTERAIVLSSDNGLIGSPEFGTGDTKKKKPILTFKCLLMSEIRPGCQLVFKSKKHEGTHRVVKVTHTGDTHNDKTWYTDGEAEVV